MPSLDLTKDKLDNLSCPWSLPDAKSLQFLAHYLISIKSDLTLTREFGQLVFLPFNSL